SGAVDYLAQGEVAAEVSDLFQEEPQMTLAAPEILIVEVISALRRTTAAGRISAWHASEAIEDLGRMRLELFPSLPLRRRAWELRENVTAYDAMFVALAELLGEPLATKDRPLAKAVARHTSVETILLGSQ
ncbi:MAG: type II toxin-antitoxin system VapC family toxin, partial [Solirubrobacterales bacterium]|nr:type II toxin-antitoxin system VapC family toxin [Solirubrobacterales bacterium]